MRYTPKFKQTTVNSFYSSGLPKSTFSKKYKIDRETLKSWLNDFSQTETVDNESFIEVKLKAENIRWTEDKKLWAVFTYFSLNEPDKGAFLRKNALYSHEVVKWKLEMTKGLEIGYKNLQELKILAQKLKEQEAIIELQKKTSQFFQDEVRN